jgi:electron transport complex protein RnfC
MRNPMSTRTFRGGIHPPENKHWTEAKTIEAQPLPRRVVIPLQQHTGAPCEPLVKLGDTVRAGQKIGEAAGFVSAPVHASISGTVAGIQLAAHPAIATPVRSVIIESDGTPQDSSWPAEGGAPVHDWTRLEPAEIRAIIKEAGVVGLGGAAFPTHVKLAPPEGRKVDSLIINGVECEPYLTADHRLMLECADGIIDGIRIVLKVLGLPRAAIGIEKNKPDAIAHLRERSRALGAPIDVVALKVKYPQGAEKQLIKAILGREVPSGGLPFDVGVIVQNVGTAFAVHEAVSLGKPLVERILTVSGDGVKEPKNLRVRIGTAFSEVLAFCGGAAGTAEQRVIMGGPMMGLAQYTLDVPVVKGTSGILVLARGARGQKETTCIKCGRCVEVCPMHLMPNRISDYAETEKFDLCDQYGVRDCIECGACAYICDVKRPMVHLVKYAKLNLAKKRLAVPPAAAPAAPAPAAAPTPEAASSQRGGA